MAPPNRLARESSPYLLQHAENPVDWYPWGAEALERARREDKPILLSIGYAACHWCHVMEHESFEDEAIAALMNERFVNIKVDREERPDLDQIYQLVVQLMRRSGGWPLTVFLTPDQRPFFAGTYFPPKEKYGMPGFPQVLSALADAYATQRGEVEEQAQEITQAIGRVHASSGAHADVGPDVLDRAARALTERFDARHGGFGTRPKFPNTMALDILLRVGMRGDADAMAHVKLALDHMRAGGIRDHLRGGFHRYSTDERWLVPHFEKMLYDNALLLRLYVDGFRAFKTPAYADTAREIVGYLFAEMRDESGGFFASQDADSEGHEGTFFVWTPSDLEAAIAAGTSRETARLHFGITPEGNFEKSGATVLSEVMPIASVAAELGLTLAAATAALDEARRAMLTYREKRERPTRDDKVLASWNGLLLGALADAGRALDEPTWVDAAVKGFDAITATLVRDGRVGRYFKDGVAASDRPGFLDDQAYLGNAAIDLFEATGEPRFASAARAIGAAMVAHHGDRGEGGFWFSPDDGDALITRTKDAYDQAIPSAAAMAALLCLRVGTTSDESLFSPGEKQLQLLAGAAIETAMGMSQTLLVLDRLARGSTDVVLVGPISSPATRALADVAFHAYLPNRSVIHVDPSRAESLAAAPIAAEGKTGAPGETVAYVCRGRACSAPVRDAAALAALLSDDRS
ncbi:MAG: thioredoxin domain-containing protein [Byssovorax sp.]